MPIRFACSTCGSKVRAPDGTGGRKAKCGKCGTTLVIPDADQSSDTQNVAAEARPHAPPRSPHLPHTQVGETKAGLELVETSTTKDELLTIDDFLDKPGSVTTSQSDVETILRSVSNDVLQAITLLHRCALRLDPSVSARVDGPCAFVYGIQKAVRMRPRILRLALLPGSSHDLLIQIHPSVSDRFERFEIVGGTREWKTSRYEVPIGGMPSADLRYFVDQFIEAFENTTAHRVQIQPDDILRAVEVGGNDVPKNSDTQSVLTTNSTSARTQVAPSINSLVAKQPDPAMNADSESESEDEPIHEDKSTIRWNQKQFSIHELCRRLKRGDIELQPEFQRHSVWPPTIARRFIESILMRLPCPAVYLSETEDGKYLVIDGQQRLTTIRDFYDGKIALSQLRVLSDLNGLRFRDLDQTWQTRFEDHQIMAMVLEKSCSPELKFDMFERLNTGSVRLNKQELRNCIYRGEFNHLLRELAELPEFVGAVGWKEPNRRMKGEELVLRFFTFLYHNVEGIKNYEEALSAEMRDNANRSVDALECHREDFRKALSICISVFGPLPFRSWVRARGDADPNGRWESRFSGTALEVLMSSLALHPKNTIMRNADSIREEFVHLLTGDQFFFDSMTFGTNSPTKMSYRNLTWRAALRQVLDSTVAEPRCFELAFKEQLWRADPTCAICRQRIHTADDAAVDHVEHYWRGGKTIPSNARLTHRYCNSKRGGRDDEL